MKTSFGLWLVYLLISLTGCSQTNKIENGYAYAREILGGKPRVSLGEDGSAVTKSKKPGKQYFIYTETKDTSPFIVRNIWIAGIEYFAEAEPVKDFPVTIPGSYDTLFASAKFNVWKINVGKLISSSDTVFTKPEKPGAHDVLIGYLIKGRLHYYSIAKIKYLEPLSLP
ncbi:MAG: hypothetical protein ABIO81_00975 [Ginsengibacter sp.]